MELNKKQILEGNYKYPDKLVKLTYTRHFIERLEERGLSLDVVPSMVRVTKDNIQSGRTTDGERLKSVVIRLKYSKNKDMFIVLNPFDGAAKSMWFNNEKATNRKNSQQRLRYDRRKDQI